MANMNDKAPSRAQAVVTGGLTDSIFNVRAGTCEFAIGGQSGTALGTDPYELLSASLAACTAMTLRFHALQRKYPLSDFEVAVSYRHGADDGHDVFERTITLHGGLDEGQRTQLLQDANKSPVGRTLGLNVDIRTRDSVSDGYPSDSPANYEEDLRELSIPNVDPD
jgi:putative redox protein